VIGRTVFWAAAATYTVLYTRFKWKEEREMMYRVLWGEKK
jgi:hypothetical protein